MKGLLQVRFLILSGFQRVQYQDPSSLKVGCVQSAVIDSVVRIRGLADLGSPRSSSLHGSVEYIEKFN